MDKPDSETSILEDCYWLFVGQFTDSGADRIRSLFVTIGFATAVVALTAATSALLANVQNWPTVVVLTTVGILTLVGVWFTALGRLDPVLLAD